MRDVAARRLTHLHKTVTNGQHVSARGGGEKTPKRHNTTTGDRLPVCGRLCWALNRSLLFAGALACALMPSQLLASGDIVAPGGTSFAYAASDHVAPLRPHVLERIVDPDIEFLSGKAPSDPRISPLAAPPSSFSRSGLCSTMVSVARANGLPAPFFANLIWQESTFNFKVISPAGAQGIAQFMPKTAVEHGLTNPFEPVHALHALHAAAKFLRRLQDQFGNLGLAAAAYNAGPGRVGDWIARRRGLPEETRNYVVHITGRPADRWTSRKFASAPEARLMPAKAPCTEVAQEVAAQAKAAEAAKEAALAALKQIKDAAPQNLARASIPKIKSVAKSRDRVQKSAPAQAAKRTRVASAR